MNKEELKEVLKGIVQQEFKNNLDSTRIFAYVQNLEQKIDKAIEYVNNHIHQETFTGYMDSYELKKLLEILKGETNYKFPFDEEVQNGLDSLSIRKEDE